MAISTLQTPVRPESSPDGSSSGGVGSSGARTGVASLEIYDEYPFIDFHNGKNDTEDFRIRIRATDNETLTIANSSNTIAIFNNNGIHGRLGNLINQTSIPTSVDVNKHVFVY